MGEQGWRGGRGAREGGRYNLMTVQINTIIDQHNDIWLWTSSKSQCSGPIPSFHSLFSHFYQHLLAPAKEQSSLLTSSITMWLPSNLTLQIASYQAGTEPMPSGYARRKTTHLWLANKPINVHLQLKCNQINWENKLHTPG